MKPRYIYPPVLTEEGLMTMVRRDIAVPSGRVFHLNMGQWHWGMIAFHDHFNEKYNRGPLGLLGEFLEQYKNQEDDCISGVIMILMRKDYTKFTQGCDEGEVPRFVNPGSIPLHIQREMEKNAKRDS